MLSSETLGTCLIIPCQAFISGGVEAGRVGGNRGREQYDECRRTRGTALLRLQMLSQVVVVEWGLIGIEAELVCIYIYTFTSASVEPRQTCYRYQHHHHLSAQLAVVLEAEEECHLPSSCRRSCEPYLQKT